MVRFCIKIVVESGWSYVEDSSDFKDKIKELLRNITLVTANG